VKLGYSRRFHYQSPAAYDQSQTLHRKLAVAQSRRQRARPGKMMLDVSTVTSWRYGSEIYMYGHGPRGFLGTADRCGYKTI